MNLFELVAGRVKAVTATAAIERIIDLTAGSPFYIQIICNRLVEYMNRKRARAGYRGADVEQVEGGINPWG